MDLGHEGVKTGVFLIIPTKNWSLQSIYTFKITLFFISHSFYKKFYNNKNLSNNNSTTNALEWNLLFLMYLFLTIKGEGKKFSKT